MKIQLLLQCILIFKMHETVSYFRRKLDDRTGEMSNKKSERVDIMKIARLTRVAVICH